MGQVPGTGAPGSAGAAAASAGGAALPAAVAQALAEVGAGRTGRGARAAPTLLLLGEQHDDPEHPLLHARTVAALAANGQLAALVLEMADQGSSTQGLGLQADAEAVRAALRWNEAGWPWASYAPAIMAAVRAGVPVLGGNLPRARQRPAMADATLDNTLSEAGLARQETAIREGHCGLLPASQIRPMTRIQIARDRAMAEVLEAQAAPGGVVVLLAGFAHVDAEVGVPRHLTGQRIWTHVTWPLKPPQKDYCAQLRQQWQTPRPPAPTPAPTPGPDR